MRNAVLGLVVIALVGVGIYSYQKSKEVSQQRGAIKVGVVLGLTGYASVDSLNVQRGLELAKEDLAKKGVNVDLIIQDDKTDAKQTVSSFKYLIDNVKPDAIVGPIWSFLEQAAEPSITSSKVVTFSPANTSEYAAISPYIFHGAVNVSRSVDVIVDWLKMKNIKKVAVIVSNDGWGVTSQKSFEDAARVAGVEVVVSEALQSQSGDVSGVMSIMSKVKNVKSEAILFTGYDEVGIALAKKNIELGINLPVLVQSTMYAGILDRGQLSKEQLSNMDYLAMPTDKEFYDKFKGKFGVAPGNYSDRAYDGLMLLVDAIQKTNHGGGDEIAKYIRGNTYNGYGGEYKYDNKGDLSGGAWIVLPVVQN